MLDEQDGEIPRQAIDGREEIAALILRHARRRLVEQQHLGLGGERQRDLQQALLPIGQLLGDGALHMVEAQRGEDRMGLLDGLPIAGQSSPPDPRLPAPFADREGHCVQRGDLGKERVDLEGAHQPAPHAGGGRLCGDVVAIEQDLPGVGLQHARQEVDQRRLARAIGADEGVALALGQGKGDVAGDHQRAERLVDPLSGEGGGHESRCHDLGASREAPPSSPLGRNTTTAISSMPIQKYQYCGLTPEKWSRATM